MVPTGRVIAPTPGNTASSAIEKTGLPTPFGFVIPIWLAVPVNVVEVIAPALVSTIKPLKLAFARFRTCPAKVIVGLPAIPSPSEIARPVPETAIERPVMAVEDVFTWNPVPEFTSDNKAPVVLILKSPCAPPSVIDNPLVTPT